MIGCQTAAVKPRARGHYAARGSRPGRSLPESSIPLTKQGTPAPSDYPKMVLPTTQTPGADPAASNGRRTLHDAVIRLAGNSQDGIQTIGSFLARLAGRSDQDVMTYR